MASNPSEIPNHSNLHNENTLNRGNPNDPVDWNLYKPSIKWFEVPRQTQAKSLTDHELELPLQFKFTVLSYNILAQALIRRELFPLSSKQALKFATRRQNLSNEMKLYSADIMCLQEIDHYDDYYYKSLVEDPTGGYAGGHWTRKLGTKSDGCATFWKRNSFELVDAIDLNYNELTLKPPYVTDPDCCDRSELERGNMGQILALKRIGNFEPQNLSCGVIIFNTHLFWNPRYNYVRLIQGVVALEQIIEFKKSRNLNWPVIVCGDLNNSSGDPFYEAFFERKNLVNLWKNQECWLTPRTHYSKWQAHVIQPPQAVLDEENAPIPQTEKQKNDRQAFVTSILERLEKLELPELVSCYKEYKTLDPKADYEGQPVDYEPPYSAIGAWWRGPLDYIAVMAKNQSHSENDEWKLKPLKMLAIPSLETISPIVDLKETLKMIAQNEREDDKRSNSKNGSNGKNGKNGKNSNGSNHTNTNGEQAEVVEEKETENSATNRWTRFVSLPNDVRGSDHLPLMVEFGAICNKKM